MKKGATYITRVWKMGDRYFIPIPEPYKRSIKKLLKKSDSGVYVKVHFKIV